MLHDPLANALNNIKLNDRIGMGECTLHPASKLIERTLELIKENGYIGGFEKTKREEGGEIKVKLIGRINSCGVIKPRYPVKQDEIEEYEMHYLPAKNFGILLISTPQGLMTHTEAKEKKTGGVLLAYIY